MFTADPMAVKKTARKDYHPELWLSTKGAGLIMKI